MRKTAGHYVLGTEGLALLRTWLVADDGTLGRRVDELARMASAPDAPHDQASGAPQIRLLGTLQHLWHGEPGRPGRLDDAGFPAHRSRLAGAPRGVAAQHQFGARAAGAHRVEGPCLPGGAAGQPGQALDGDRAEDAAQCGGKTAFVHQSMVTPLGARWCM